MSVALPVVSIETVPDLVPARMLNEFAYCPRLSYLEWVQGEFAHNADTLEGRFGHRRADQPDDRPVPDPGGDGEEPVETIHARSVMLSAPQEGLIARIDVLETDGQEATPVDYKRGLAPNLVEGAYEPERVQLCAQALILRENGYQCQRGIIYFIGSKRRVVIEFDDGLVTRTRELLQQMRSMAQAQQLPPPLVDSPKCPRCSLVGICLPDETRWLSAPDHAEPDDGAEIRRLMPARDDAQPAYVQMQGGQVGKSGERLTVKLKGEEVADFRIHDVSQLCVFGNVQVTTQALQELIQRGIPVCYFSFGGWFHGWTTGLIHKNVELRMAQFRTASEPSRSLRLAQAFTAGKIRNGRTILRRNLEADPEGILDRLNDLAEQASETTSAESLLGIEGTAARIYFSGFAQLIKGGDAFRFEDRNRRPPRDPINAVLSYLYAMLAKDLTVTVQTVGFDPMLGFYHRPRYGRPALALDLAEEFRPLVAESTALTLVNSGELTESHFVRRAGACVLTEVGRKVVIGAYERRLDQLITHPLFGYRISYRRVFEVQARLLARALSGELSEYPNFLTR
jgi:CRISPR-associated protein Cas1